MKVFISSTYKDLIEYRKCAVEVVNWYQCTPLAMEFFGAQPDEPKTVCDKEIRDCHIFVGIYAHRYGFVPQGSDKSITRLEYELAQELRKDCLCFVVKEDFPWNPQLIEKKNNAKLRNFLALVKNEKTVSSFESPEHFKGKLASSLGKLMVDKARAYRADTVTRVYALTEAAETSSVCRVSIPLSPTPYLAHPCPLPAHFIGRAEEIESLSQWFYNETEPAPVLVLEAIGGMGKSAMTWVWLHRDILEKNTALPGVFWWSFYEAPFETFIQHLACYVLGKEAEKPGLPGTGTYGTPGSLGTSGAPGTSGTSGATGLENLLAALYNHKFLLVLDGLERILCGYAGLEAMFIQDKKFQGGPGSEAEWDRRQREPVQPAAARFLKHLAAPASKSKVLITSRLMPAPLEGLAGVKHLFLKGLSPRVAVRFLQDQGVKGTRSELEQAGRVYDFHPLLLKLLATAIGRTRSKDIAAVYRGNLIDEQEPHQILEKSFGLLSKTEQKVATSLAVFRGTFTFDAAKALFKEMEEDRLWASMQELSRLGFLFYSEKEDRFDIHPILRSFLYRCLTNPHEVHGAAVHYFRALPKLEKIITLEDLAPVIEIYHHLVKAGNYDEACNLFYERINKPTYYQLSAYPLIIELLRELFPEGEELLPRLKKEADQAWTLAALANSYALSGQPALAVPLYLTKSKLNEKNTDKKNLAIGLGNVAHMAQISLGKLSAAGAHLQKSISLFREINYEYGEAVGHMGWGWVLAFQGRVQGNAGEPGAQEELSQSTHYWEKTEDYQGLSLDSAYRSLAGLVQGRLEAVLTVFPGTSGEHPVHPDLDPGNPGRGESCIRPNCCREALAQAHQALAFAEKTIKAQFPYPRDFVRAYWLLGEALVHLHIQGGITPGAAIQPGMEIPFYDDYFQQVQESLAVQPGRELPIAERCLQEALRRCRKANMVEIEPDILLALVRLEWAGVHTLPPQEKVNRLPSLAEPLREVHDLARRCGYRLVLADLHLFCGQALLECQCPDSKTLLGLTAPQHLQKTKDYAQDDSDFADLYPAKDPDFYKGIPGYEMLKRGLSPEERILNGYFPAYQMAEILESSL